MVTSKKTYKIDNGYKTKAIEILIGKKQEMLVEIKRWFFSKILERQKYNSK